MKERSDTNGEGRKKDSSIQGKKLKKTKNWEENKET